MKTKDRISIITNGALKFFAAVAILIILQIVVRSPYNVFAQVKKQEPQPHSIKLEEKSVSLKASSHERSAEANKWWQRVRTEKLSYIKTIRTWSSEKSTRIVIELQHQVKYRAKILKEPDRFYVDLFRTVLHPAKKSLEVDDGIVRQVRASQNTSTTARVVIDLYDNTRVEHFVLTGPPRLVIDVYGRRKEVPDYPTDNIPVSISKQFGLKVKTIILDPGHGGKDQGARGSHQLLEKDLVLDVARRTKKLLETNGKFHVLLTREQDHYLPLESRTAFANQQSADLFISIHANAHRSKSKHGVETFYLSPAKTSEDAALAALENAMSEQTVSKLGPLIERMLKTMKKTESRNLAQSIQNSLAKNTGLKDRGVKTAPFVVLIGTNMPSALVEIGFISHAEENKKLRSESFREKIARALCDAIVNYNHLD